MMFDVVVYPRNHPLWAFAAAAGPKKKQFKGVSRKRQNKESWGKGSLGSPSRKRQSSSKADAAKADAVPKADSPELPSREASPVSPASPDFDGGADFGDNAESDSNLENAGFLYPGITGSKVHEASEAFARRIDHGDKGTYVVKHFKTHVGADDIKYPGGWWGGLIVGPCERYPGYDVSAPTPPALPDLACPALLCLIPSPVNRRTTSPSSSRARASTAWSTSGSRAGTAWSRTSTSTSALRSGLSSTWCEGGVLCVHTKMSQQTRESLRAS
jgi:hypothetical protein